MKSERGVARQRCLPIAQGKNPGHELRLHQRFKCVGCSGLHVDPVVIPRVGIIEYARIDGLLLGCGHQLQRGLRGAVTEFIHTLSYVT